VTVQWEPESRRQRHEPEVIVAAPDPTSLKPGDSGSLDELFQTLENLLVRLTYEAFLHLEAYPDYQWANDLGAKISHVRAGFDNLLTDFWQRVGEVCD